MNFTSNKINPAVWGTCIVLLMLPELLMLDTKTWWDAPVVIVFNILFYGFFAWLILRLGVADWAKDGACVAGGVAGCHGCLQR